MVKMNQKLSLCIRLSLLLLLTSISQPPFLVTASTFRGTSATSSSSVLRYNRGGGPVASIKNVKNNNGKGNKNKAKSKAVSPVNSVSGTGTASILMLVFNLVKNIVGVSVLSLPAAIATFGDEKTVLIPVAGLIALIGLLSGYGFAIIGKVCAYTGATTYREAWSKSIGYKTSWIPAVSSTLKTFLTCMAISMVLGDTFGTLLGRPVDQRTITLIGLTVLILLPLCWMKNLSSLAPFSLLGIMGMAYTAIAMTIRYLDGSYNVITDATTSKSLLNAVPRNLRPQFGTNGWKSVNQPATLILLCMLSTAYMAHFNAPKFYLELQDNTLPRYFKMVSLSFGTSIVLMGYIATIGFLTFGKASSGVILNNYAPKDTFMYASRVAVAVSLVFTYPLAFQGCRDGILDLIQVPKEKRTNNTLNLTTILLLTIITILAASLKDVSLVLALGGATLGNALTYVYPALMYKAIVKKQNRKDEELGLNISIGSAILGIIMGAIGTKMALEKQGGAH